MVLPSRCWSWRPSHAGDGAADLVLAVTRKGAATDRQGAAADRKGNVDHWGVITDCQGAAIDRQGVAAERQGAIDLAASRSKRLSLRYVLIMEAIDLDIWIFTPTPRWAPTVVIYDNDLE
jgi:hypothetical protein